MSNEAQQLLAAVLALPERERAEIAGKLIQSLDAEVDMDAEQLWQEEILRRSEEIKQGRARTIPWEEVRRELMDNGESTDAR